MVDCLVQGESNGSASSHRGCLCRAATGSSRVASHIGACNVGDRGVGVVRLPHILPRGSSDAVENEGLETIVSRNLRECREGNGDEGSGELHFSEGD